MTLVWQNNTKSNVFKEGIQLDWMLDPPEDELEEWEERSIDDIDPEDSDLYMLYEAADNAASGWQNSRNL